MELHHHDILPEGHPDPMLMSIHEVAEAAEDFARKNACAEAHFLMGVLFARVSYVAGDVLRFGMDQS